MNRPGWSSIPTALMLLAIVPSAPALWSDDPAQNLALGDRAGDQVQAKIAPTPDGGSYISWFDNSTGGYDVYLQRLDAAGNELWAHNGLLQADRSFSSTEDYGLDIDTGGNALLAFRDDRFGSTLITAVKIAPDGSKLWGDHGVQLTSGEYVSSPRITGSSDGNVVVSWTHEGSVALQKLDATGAPLWGAGVRLSDNADGTFFLAALHASDSGGVIVSWVRNGPQFWDPKHLQAQKLSATGNTLWNTPGPHLTVFDGGSLQFGSFPAFISDGSGGALFSWYGVSPLQCYAQRVLADGTEAFGHNGAAGSTNMAQARVSPSVSFRAVTEETFLFWTEKDAGQVQFGLYGQKFDSGGSRQWTDQGKVLIPLASDELSFVSNLQVGTGAMVFAFSTPSHGNTVVLATRVDGNGGFSWPGEIIEACSLPSEKGRLTAAGSSTGYAILAWHDGRSGNADVFGQNVNLDGTLGVSGGDTFDVGIACLTPNLTLPGVARFEVVVTNTTNQPINLHGHLDAILCNGRCLTNIEEHGAVLGPGMSKTIRVPVAIPAHPSLTCDRDLEIRIVVQDNETMWEEDDSCIVSTSCP